MDVTVGAIQSWGGGFTYLTLSQPQTNHGAGFRKTSNLAQSNGRP